MPTKYKKKCVSKHSCLFLVRVSHRYHCSTVFKHLSHEKLGKSLLLIFSQVLSLMLNAAGTHWNKSFLLCIRVYEGSFSADSVWEKLLLLRQSRGTTFIIIIFLRVIFPQGNRHSCSLHTEIWNHRNGSAGISFHSQSSAYFRS